MQLDIVSSPRDFSLPLIIEAAEKRGLKINKKYYEQLCTSDPAQKASKNTCAILRFPFLATNYLISQLIEADRYSAAQLLDAEVFLKHPQYEDKLYQHWLLRKKRLALPYEHCNTRKYAEPSFPLVAKRRISTRSRHVFVIRSQARFDYFFARHKISEYILEPLLKLKHDYRVLVLGNKILGSVDRTPRINRSGPQERLGLKVAKAAKPGRTIERMALQATKLLNADFCGVDVLVTSTGKKYVGECNVAPQFVAASRELDVDIAGQVIDFLIKKSKN